MKFSSVLNGNECEYGETKSVVFRVLEYILYTAYIRCALHRFIERILFEKNEDVKHCVRYI